MGKGTKHAADWVETTLQVVLDARRLYTHSMKIMGNRKVFSPLNDFRDLTLMRIHEDLLDVYLKTFYANRINVVTEPWRAKERVEMQLSAREQCQELLSLFELAKHQFHIDSRKFWNWMCMLVALKDKLIAWHKSDCSRYADLLDFSSDAKSGCRLNIGCQRVVAVR